MNPPERAHPDELTVFYDGACPLCSREIAWYRRRAARGMVRYLDVSRADCPLPAHLDRQAVLARFHVLTDDGRTLDGAAAFLALWSSHPGLAPVTQLVRALHLLPLLDWGYARFLPWRDRLGRLWRSAQ